MNAAAAAVSSITTIPDVVIHCIDGAGGTRVDVLLDN